MKVLVRYFKRFVFSILFLYLLLQKAAFAGPPFFTDDPVPVEYKHSEVYFASTYMQDKGGREGSLPLIDMNYGIIPEVHAHVATVFNYNHEKGEPDGDEPGEDPHTRYGYGDTELGFKWRLIQETKRIPQVAVYPAVGIPTGNFQKGLGAGRSVVFLPVWLQKGWNKWTAYGGGGYWINPGAGNKNWTYLGGVLQRDITSRFSFGGELFFRSKDAVDAQNGFGINFGSQIHLTENHHLLASAGTDLYGPRHFTSYLAYQLTF